MANSSSLTPSGFILEVARHHTDEEESFLYGLVPPSRAPPGWSNDPLLLSRATESLKAFLSLVGPSPGREPRVVPILIELEIWPTPKLIFEGTPGL